MSSYFCFYYETISLITAIILFLVYLSNFKNNKKGIILSFVFYFFSLFLVLVLDYKYSFFVLFPLGIACYIFTNKFINENKKLDIWGFVLFIFPLFTLYFLCIICSWCLSLISCRNGPLN